MRRAAIVIFAAACAAGAARPAAAQQWPFAPELAAFVEIAADRTSAYVNEPIGIELRVGFEPGFFKSNAIQTSRQELDVPVQVDLPWLADLPGVVVLDDDKPRPAHALRMSLAVNDRRVEADRIDNRTVLDWRFFVLRIRARVAATKPGTIVIPAPTLRFSYSLAFHEDLVSGRIPIDRREAVLRGQELSLVASALPEAGRPPAFGGAVGQFSVKAAADKTEVAAGESVRLTLTISGSGNLKTFEAPRLDGLPGFHVFGTIDAKSGPDRTIVYDLAPENERIRAIPPLPLHYFDPAPPPRYKVAATAPIPITVKSRGPSVRTSRPSEVRRGPSPGVDDVFGLKPSGAARAERAFASGRYEEAAALFQAALAEPRSNEGAILFDLGDTWFRLDRHAEALLAWRRAALRLPRDEQVRFNAALAASRLALAKPADASPWDAVDRALGAVTREELLAASVALAGARARRMVRAPGAQDRPHRRRVRRGGRPPSRGPRGGIAVAQRSAAGHRPSDRDRTPSLSARRGAGRAPAARGRAGPRRGDVGPLGARDPRRRHRLDRTRGRQRGGLMSAAQRRTSLGRDSGSLIGSSIAPRAAYRSLHTPACPLPRPRCSPEIS